jgi:hypothetical protein
MQVLGHEAIQRLQEAGVGPRELGAARLISPSNESIGQLASLGP